MPIENHKLAATYGRVSTAGQEEEQTIGTQEYAMRKLAEEYGYSVVREYKDEGWPGDTLARPDLDKLREEAKRGTFEAVIIYDPDRIARKLAYQQLVMDELQDAGIEIVYVTTPTPKNHEEKIMHDFKGLFAEYERAKIAERTRLGKVRKARDGHIITSAAPYGYQYVRKGEHGHGYYEINEEEARAVRKIFSWVADDGLTVRNLVYKLRDEGIQPRHNKNGVWSTSTLSTLLRNKTYIGEAHWGSTYAVKPENPQNKERYKKIKKSSRRHRPENEWITIPVPAIVDEDTFYRAQKQLDRNKELSKRNKKNKYLLANRIYCVCGSTRTGEGPKKGHRYYRCSDRVNSYPLPRSCYEKGVNANHADKKVWQRIARLMSSPDLMRKQIQRWADNRKSKSSEAGEDEQVLQNEIDKLKKQEDRYMKAYGEEAITLEKLKEYTSQIREKISDLENRIQKAREDAEAQRELDLSNEREIEQFAAEAKQALKSLHFEQKRDIVLSVIDKIIATQTKLHVYGFIPVENVKFHTEHRYCWSAKRREVDLV